MKIINDAIIVKIIQIDENAIILALLSLQSIATASFIDKQELIKMDSRLYTVHLECGNKQMLSKVHQFGFEKFFR